MPEKFLIGYSPVFGKVLTFKFRSYTVGMVVKQVFEI
jgi:hypothetical protein